MFLCLCLCLCVCVCIRIDFSWNIKHFIHFNKQLKVLYSSSFCLLYFLLHFCVSQINRNASFNFIKYRWNIFLTVFQKESILIYNTHTHVIHKKNNTWQYWGWWMVKNECFLRMLLHLRTEFTFGFNEWNINGRKILFSQKDHVHCTTHDNIR